MHSRLVLQKIKKKTLYDPFLCMGFCLKDTEPLRGGSSLLTFRSPEVPSTHFINLERIKAESTLEPLTGFEPGDPLIASTQDQKVLGSHPKYMIDQVLKPNLISRLSATFGSYKIKCEVINIE